MHRLVIHLKRHAINQFWYIKIQPKTTDLSTRLREIIITEFVGFIPRSLMLRSIVLGWILICQNRFITRTHDPYGYQSLSWPPCKNKDLLDLTLLCMLQIHSTTGLALSPFNMWFFYFIHRRNILDILDSMRKEMKCSSLSSLG